jgi:hypothetical protein
VRRLRTGLIILAGELNRNRPGNRPFVERGMKPISSVGGTWKDTQSKKVSGINLGSEGKLVSFVLLGGKVESGYRRHMIDLCIWGKQNMKSWARKVLYTPST